MAEGKNVTLGGDRLGSGNKNKVWLHNFERSTHDLSYVFRSTMAAGTLVPFMKLLALSGDTFDIELNADVLTAPTVGPLFGSFKLQLDIFQCPIRLYQAQLHNNKIGIGMKMNQVKLPQLQLVANNFDPYQVADYNCEQISPSSLLSYLGVRGIGVDKNIPIDDSITIMTNGIKMLAYWDIYKNYYANKQEGIGAVINTPSLDKIKITNITVNRTNSEDKRLGRVFQGDQIHINGKNLQENYLIAYLGRQRPPERKVITELGYVQNANDGTNVTIIITRDDLYISDIRVGENAPNEIKPRVTTFKLENIDKIREEILRVDNNQYYIMSGKDDKLLSPIKESIRTDITTDLATGKKIEKCAGRYTQQGLALKTYQSDIFNNWLSEEWIEGANGINEITAVDVRDGKLRMDVLILQKKVYDMLNRVAVSGGTYYDWISAIYSEEPFGMVETPIYMGGMSQEIVFQEVISNSATDNEPLGTLAGRGKLLNERKGGKTIVKVAEPSYIIGIVSITPRIDYSQGNDWDGDLKTMDDLHKPSLDGIGFQDLITEQMAWWDSDMLNQIEIDKVKYSAGKQPAWINYMTNYNQTYGNFALINNQMFMTLNRRYEMNKEERRIADLTTYIDPSKFNYIFAQTDISAQNFWLHIGVKITARRKISAKQIPNL